MKLYFATSNTHKVAEVAAILRAACLSIEVMPASAVGGMPPVIEDGATFEANARKKAEALAAVLRQSRTDPAWLVAADDSGLCVDALDGAPGVRSARFAGPDATDDENNRKLLKALGSVDRQERTAAFHCCIAVVGSDGSTPVFSGRCPGRILMEPRGSGGFGYDPLFVPDGWEQSYAELPESDKNRISHRARALAEVARWFNATSN